MQKRCHYSQRPIEGWTQKEMDRLQFWIEKFNLPERWRPTLKLLDQLEHCASDRERRILLNPDNRR